MHELKLVANILRLEYSLLTKEELVTVVVSNVCDGNQTKEQRGVPGTLGAMAVNIDSEVPEGGVSEGRDPPPRGVSLTDLQLRLELAKIQLEQTRIQAQAQVEQTRIEADSRIRQAEARSQIPKFDVSNMIKLVPPFFEDVDKYFRSFQRVAGRMEWPKEYRPILPILQGKTQSAYLALSEAQCSDYEVVKREILKA